MQIDILKNLVDGYKLTDQHMTVDNSTDRLVITLNYEKVVTGLMAQLQRTQNENKTTTTAN